MRGFMTAKDAKELDDMLKTIKNVNTENVLNFDKEPLKETWFDKWVLRWV